MADFTAQDHLVARRKRQVLHIAAIHAQEGVLQHVADRTAAHTRGGRRGHDVAAGRIGDLVDRATRPREGAGNHVVGRFRRAAIAQPPILVLVVERDPRVVGGVTRLARVRARHARGPAARDDIFDIGALGQRADAVDRAIRLGRQIQIGVDDLARAVKPHARLHRVRKAEYLRLPIGRFHARPGVGRVAQPERDALGLGLGQLDADRHALGLGRVGVDIDQHRREVGRRLQAPLHVEQFHRVVAVTGRERVVAFHQQRLVALQALDLQFAHGKDGPAVDLHMQRDGGIVGIDLGQRIDDARGGVVDLLHLAEQARLGGRPLRIAKRLADRQFPAAQQFLHPRRVLFNRALQHDLRLGDHRPRAGLDLQDIARCIAISDSLDLRREVALGRQQVERIGAQAAQLAFIVLGVDRIGQFRGVDRALEQRLQFGRLRRHGKARQRAFGGMGRKRGG